MLVYIYELYNRKMFEKFSTVRAENAPPSQLNQFNLPETVPIGILISYEAENLHHFIQI